MRLSTRFFGILFAAAAITVACDETSSAPVGNVSVLNNFFDPDTTTLSASELTVTWGWVAGGVHNVTFENGPPNSGDRSTGAFTRDFSAAAAGTYRYRCTNHSTDFTTGMIGVVIKP